MAISAGAARAVTPHNTGRAPIKVMLVDDSAVVRGLVSRWIGEEAELTVVARHPNGSLAVKNIKEAQPDVVILDIEMPVMDGITALPLLLKQCPGVKIIVASTLTRRNAEISLKALSLGATDYIPKPETNRGVTTSTDFRRDLICKIKAVTGRDMAPAIEARHSARPVRRKAPPVVAVPAGQAFALRAFSPVRPRILAVGSSTGGPQALNVLFKAIASSLTGIPTVITQHMPPTFTAILAEQLGRVCGLPAKEGESGDVLTPGSVYLAPGGRHMIIEETSSGPAIKLTDGPQVNFCKPAVDPLFECVAKIYGAASLAIVLTGMGHDGAAGSGDIAAAGGSVIAQDEASSVVWGMPGATAAAGVCSAVLPLREIGNKVNNILKGAGV